MFSGQTVTKLTDRKKYTGKNSVPWKLLLIFGLKTHKPKKQGTKACPPVEFLEIYDAQGRKHIFLLTSKCINCSWLYKVREVFSGNLWVGSGFVGGGEGLELWKGCCRIVRHDFLMRRSISWRKMNQEGRKTRRWVNKRKRRGNFTFVQVDRISIIVCEKFLKIKYAQAYARL